MNAKLAKAIRRRARMENQDKAWVKAIKDVAKLLTAEGRSQLKLHLATAPVTKNEQG